MSRPGSPLAALLLLLLGGHALGSSLVADFTRNDLAGKPLHLADYRGRVVLLNFWATWCGPCMEEMPVFVRWQKQYGSQGLQILGVSMDDEEEPVQRFLKKTPLDYPVVMGDEALAKMYGGVYGLPLTFLIDAQGKIQGRYLGDADLAVLEAKIKRLLAR